MRERILHSIDIARAAVILLASAGILFLMDPAAADPLLPKTACFVAASSLLAGLSLMRLWWGGKLYHSRGPLALAVLALLAAQLLAFLMASSRPVSENSFNAWLLLGMLALSMVDLLRGERRQHGLLLSLAAGLGLTTLWALAQHFGLTPSAFGARVSAGLGNPNFLAGFLVLCLPVAMWLAFTRHPAWWMLFAAALFAAVATGSKAAWLALAFQYFALGHIGWHSKRERSWRLVFLKRWLGIGLMAASLSLALLPHETRQRLFDAFSPSNESVQFRLNTARGSLGAIAAHPLFGFGPGSFSAVYPAYRPPASMAVQSQHAYEVTHPENWLLQIGVESGLLGLAAALCSFYLLLRPLWDAAASMEGEGQLALCLFLGLAGSLVCNLASLDLFLPSSFWFFTLLASLAAARFAAPTAAFGLNAAGSAAAFVSAGILLFALMPALQAAGHWQASRLTEAGKAASSAGRYAEAVTLYDSALMGDPVNFEALYFKACSLADAGKPAEALPAFEALQAYAPDYVLVHERKALLLQQLKRPADAEREWERQVELDPWHLGAVQQLASLYASQGQIDKALGLLEAARLRFPGNADIERNLSVLAKHRGAYR